MLTQELNIRFQELEEHFRVRARTGVRRGGVAGRGGEKFEVLVTLLSSQQIFHVHIGIIKIKSLSFVIRKLKLRSERLQ